MTKRKAKKSAGAAKRGASKAKGGSASAIRKPVDLESIRQKIANAVAGDALDMVNDVIAEVHKGQHTPMKYLFEMIGLYPAAADEEAPGDDSLIQTLLRRLGFPEHTENGQKMADASDETPQSTVTKDAGDTPRPAELAENEATVE